MARASYASWADKGPTGHNDLVGTRRSPLRRP